MAAALKLNLARSWPRLARTAWLVIAGLSLGVLALGVPIKVITIYSDWRFQGTYPAVAGFVSREAYAAYFLGLNYAVPLVCVGVAALIAWRRATEPMAWLAAVLLVVEPVMFSLGGYIESWLYYPAPWPHILPVVREGLVWPIGLGSLLAFLFVLFFPTAALARAAWPGWPAARPRW